MPKYDTRLRTPVPLQAIFLGCLLVALPLAGARGQSGTDTSVFIPPAAGRLRCQAIFRPAADTLARGTSMKFYVGRKLGTNREFEVTYDTAGHPQSLVLVAEEIFQRDSVTVDGITVRFGAGSAAGLWQHAWRRWTDGTATTHQSEPEAVHAALPLRQLTLDEQRQSRRLAEWLWQHRCAGSRDAS